MITSFGTTTTISWTTTRSTTRTTSRPARTPTTRQQWKDRRDQPVGKLVRIRDVSPASFFITRGSCPSWGGGHRRLRGGCGGEFDRGLPRRRQSVGGARRGRARRHDAACAGHRRWSGIGAGAARTFTLWSSSADILRRRCRGLRLTSRKRKNKAGKGAGTRRPGCRTRRRSAIAARGRPTRRLSPEMNSGLVAGTPEDELELLETFGSGSEQNPTPRAVCADVEGGAVGPGGGRSRRRLCSQRRSIVGRHHRSNQPQRTHVDTGF